MPFAVPSHMGLIAPLWRRWPTYFDAPCMCIGAVMPDVVDGINGALRGHLGQGIGHSFLGVVALCVPGGLALWFLTIACARRLKERRGDGFWSRCWNLARASVLQAPATGDFWGHSRVVIGSLYVGVLSHLFFDVISHVECPWCYPWVPKLAIFPAWWETVWFRFPLPFYENPYPIGPHFVSWLALSVLGAWWLLKPVFRPHLPTAESTPS
jgi:hypothetical protein